MGVQDFGELFITVVLLMLALGMVMVVVLAPTVPHLGRLPGDFLSRQGNFTLLVPLVTMLLLGLALTIVVNLFANLLR